ncbi:MAG: hypothetical protein E7610_03135 [Ruminococcaceae bacterium]|nr:hypothetical protein [Oscillospiraceae bacterium]
MAGSAKNDRANQTLEIIDPIYQKYVKSVVRALSSSDFYDYFMDSIGRAENEIQFSNRRMEKLVDLEWVDKIENTLEGFQSVVASPRNMIKEEELIVNVANAKKCGNEVIRHLAQHAALVEDFNEETGDVRPNRLMQKYREDTITLYENRVVFTTLELAHQFVKIRHDALFEAMSDEFGAKLKLCSDMTSATETVHLDMFLHIRDIDSALETDDKNRDVFDRISRLHRMLSTFMTTPFAQKMSKQPRVKGTITKTNVLKKNPNYRKVVELFEFLHGYGDIGYTIKIIEQNPEIDENFERDIYHNILFNYLVLKGHLERDKDRRLPTPAKQKKRTLKPKFIKQIIEELTEDYDLPDVEIRKVLIEELTKEQLMREEAEERRRLVEEQEQRKKEEAERLRREQEAEKERIRLEKEAEKERIRQEKAAEEERLRYERMEREHEDRRRSKLFREEVEYFRSHLEEQLQARQELAAQEEEVKQDFADAVEILEETERLKQEEAEREKQRRREEKERKKYEEFLAAQQAIREEEERLERERLEREAEEERLRIEQHERDMAAVEVYVRVLSGFRIRVEERLKQRERAAERARREQEAREEERRLLRQTRQTPTK